MANLALQTAHQAPPPVMMPLAQYPTLLVWRRQQQEWGPPARPHHLSLTDFNLARYRLEMRRQDVMVREVQRISNLEEQGYSEIPDPVTGHKDLEGYKKLYKICGGSKAYMRRQVDVEEWVVDEYGRLLHPGPKPPLPPPLQRPSPPLSEMEGGLFDGLPSPMQVPEQGFVESTPGETSTSQLQEPSPVGDNAFANDSDLTWLPGGGFVAGMPSAMQVPEQPVFEGFVEGMQGDMSTSRLQEPSPVGDNAFANDSSLTWLGGDYEFGQLDGDYQFGQLGKAEDDNDLTLGMWPR